MITRYYFILREILSKYDQRNFNESGAIILVGKSIFFGVMIFCNMLVVLNEFIILRIGASLIISILLVFQLLLVGKKYQKLDYNIDKVWWLVVIVFEIVQTYAFVRWGMD